MNTLIKSIALQSGGTLKQNLGVYQFYESELEAFVKSIVMECIHISNTIDAAYGAPSTTGQMLKTHFDLDSIPARYIEP